MICPTMLQSHQMSMCGNVHDMCKRFMQFSSEVYPGQGPGSQCYKLHALLHIESYFNPRPCAAFYCVERLGERGPSEPPAVRPLMDLELCEKNERVVRSERKPIAHNFKVSGQLMTSEVRSNTRSGPSDDYLWDAIKSTGMSKLVPNWV